MSNQEVSAPAADARGSVAPARAHGLSIGVQRWLQLAFGVLCMVMIANLQYGWTLFVTPIHDGHPSWSLPWIQGSFTLFVAVETWLVPIEGRLVDRFGPRAVVLAGGVCTGLGWSVNSMAGSLWVLYLGQAICGIGGGAVYATCVGNAVKWFPDRRGLAAGLTAAGYGAGSAATVVPISSMIESSGYASTFLYFGLAQGVIILIFGSLLRAPSAAVATMGKSASGAVPPPRADADAAPRPLVPAISSGAPRQFAWREMLGTRVFWIMYLMFVLMAAPGLFVTGNLKQFAVDFKVAKESVTLIWFSAQAVTIALTIDRIFNGIARPVFGWVSDRLGRENTMFVAFGAEAIGTFCLSRFGANPIAFVFITGLVFFAWGEIYSLFPSTCADTYGWKNATTNYGLMYTAKGAAALLLLLANPLVGMIGWSNIFVIASVMNITAAILAIAVLKPMRRRMVVA